LLLLFLRRGLIAGFLLVRLVPFVAPLRPARLGDGHLFVLTAAHNACIRELLREVSVHGKADRHMRLLKIETESRLGTLWDQEGCSQFCSKEEL
jgi:hypothetical protein